jgi:cytochrome b
MPATASVRVWDLPTRLFHWALVVCIVGAFVSIKLGGNAVAWHFRFGYTILALLLFRIAWGFIGPRYARFASFPPNPLAALGYLRGRVAHAAGHSPLAALSVYALLAALAFQASTGLFANDAIMWDGPWRNRVSGSTSDWLTSLHKTNENILIALVGLHLAAIAFYRLFRRKRLTRAMLTGRAEAPGGASPRPPDAEDGAAVRLRALLTFAASCAAVWVFVEWLP